MDDGNSITDEKETNCWPTLLLLLWIGLPERLQISYLPPIRVFKKKTLNPISNHHLVWKLGRELWGGRGDKLREQMDE